MIAFTGRSFDKTKMKNKPIEEGFKIWAVGYGSYINSWLFHSQQEGIENINKSTKFERPAPLQPTRLAPTQQVPVILLQEIQAKFPHQKRIVFLDNLFLNLEVAHCLIPLGVGVMGTSRKNVTGFPQELLDLKEDNKKLAWNSLIGFQVDQALCFLWQDNNAVLGITTGFSLHQEEDKVIRSRKRPKETSTNAKIVRPVFGSEVIKELPIPTAIDSYNYQLGGIDIANQLRRDFSSQRPTNYRWWKPLFFWLIDVCTVNSFIIWRDLQRAVRGANTNDHNRFQKELTQALLTAKKPLPCTAPVALHSVQPLDNIAYCVAPACRVQGQNKRKFGDNLPNRACARVLGEYSLTASNAPLLFVLLDLAGINGILIWQQDVL